MIKKNYQDDSEIEAECAELNGVDVQTADEIVEKEIMRGGEVEENFKVISL